MLSTPYLSNNITTNKARELTATELELIAGGASEGDLLRKVVDCKLMSGPLSGRLVHPSFMCGHWDPRG